MYMRQDELNNRIEEHLERYKNEVLKVEGEGTTVELKDNFIDGSFKLLEKYYDGDEIKRYGNDLKSSKILGMNLFLPILKNKALASEFISHILERDDLGEVTAVQFDKVINNDVNNSMDLYVEMSSGVRIYFEFTYWEDHFGSFNGEDNQDMWDNEFSKQIKKSFNLGDITREDFCKNFRINRNVSILENKNDYTVFMYPFENDPLKERMEEFEYENLIEIDLHEILYFILKRDLTEEEEEYFREFSRKYLIY